ncbi:MAG: radical SAM protein [Candidatus Schekmanbacteria bacterium]|nr:MAG: radical SAM protein [Candidatus Schekmanbacteria bacterium]
MSKYRICLINPDAPGLQDKLAYPPIGLLYIAASLEEYGFDVSYVNFCEDAEKEIPDAEIYGISIHSIAVLKESFKIAERIKKEKGRNALVVGGGACASSYFLRVLDENLIDIAVIGEGEMTMLDIAKGVPLDEIRGIAYRRGKEICINAPRPFIKNLDILPFPARHLVPINILKSKSGVHGEKGVDTTSIITSRGCPYKCAYCDTNHWKRIYRPRSAQNVADEVRHIKETYDIHHLRFMDDTYTLDSKRVMEISKKLMPLNITYIAISRADRVDRETLRMMKKSGCEELLIGVETGSEELLKRMNKGETLDHYRNAIREIKNAGIRTKVFILFGFPGENRKTVEETKAFLEETQPDKVHMSTFIPLPGTDVWNNPEKYGVTIDKEDLENYWFYWEPDDIDKGFVAKNRNTFELMRLRSEMITYLRNEEWKYENIAARTRKNRYSGFTASKLA